MRKWWHQVYFIHYISTRNYHCNIKFRGGKRDLFVSHCREFIPKSQWTKHRSKMVQWERLYLPPLIQFWLCCLSSLVACTAKKVNCVYCPVSSSWLLVVLGFSSWRNQNFLFSIAVLPNSAFCKSVVTCTVLYGSHWPQCWVSTWNVVNVAEELRWFFLFLN